MQPGRRGTGHLSERRIQDVCCARQFGRPELRGLHPHAIELVLRHSPQYGRRSLGRCRSDDDQVAHVLKEIFDEATRVLPGLDHPVDGVECGR